jgi:phosphoribosylanthranilate isomerase
VFVKICGLTSSDAVHAAVEAGADAIGFVFADSPRRISPERAKKLCRGLPGNLVRVAVMHHPSADEWAAVREEFAPDWLQTDAGDFGRLTLPAGCKPLPVYRNGQVTSAITPARVLFEGTQSGRGELADWSKAASIANRTRLILAGGLHADNVKEAIHAVEPWGVDVSSGVERKPGEKDPGRIALFIAQAKVAETL